MSRRTAAALMITRGEGRDLEVFLAQRAPELRFFGGYWAMPGGTLATEDLGDQPDDEDAGLQVCANRELFEELGLICHSLPTTESTADALREQRRALLAHEADERRDKPPSPWADIVRGATAPAPLLPAARAPLVLRQRAGVRLLRRGLVYQEDERGLHPAQPAQPLPALHCTFSMWSVITFPNPSWSSGHFGRGRRLRWSWSCFESMSVNGPEGAGAIAARRAVRFAAVKRHTRG